MFQQIGDREETQPVARSDETKLLRIIALLIGGVILVALLLFWLRC